MKNKLIIIIFTSLLCFFIYKITYHPNELLLAIGDNSCLATSIYGANGLSYNDILFKQEKRFSSLKKICFKNKSVNDITGILKSNDQVDGDRVLSIIDKASLTIINVGFYELTSYKKVDNIAVRNFLNDYNELLKTIKKYNNKEVLIIGFYPRFFNNYEELNRGLKLLCRRYSYKYVDVSTLINNRKNFYDYDYYNLNLRGNLNIAKLIGENL